MAGPSGPERDRRLAAQPRYRFRKAEAVNDVVSSFMSSDDVKRMRRFQKAAGVLQRLFDARTLAKIKPVSLIGGVLTLSVEDGPLLAELRQHHEPQLLAEFVRSGSGIHRIAWRLARWRR